MRQGPIQKRSRSRGNGRKQFQSSRSQTFDSNGPSGRVRGNAGQVFEKYLALARDALSSGDRIMAENLYQHAEHYYRIMNAASDGYPGRVGGRRPSRDEETPANGGGEDATAAEKPTEAEQPPGEDERTTV